MARGFMAKLGPFHDRKAYLATYHICTAQFGFFLSIDLIGKNVEEKVRKPFVFKRSNLYYHVLFILEKKTRRCSHGGSNENTQQQQEIEAGNEKPAPVSATAF